MATEYLTTDIDLKKVADGIRSRTGKTTAISYPDGYVSEISKLSDTSTDTVTPDKLISGTTAHDKSGKRITGSMEEVYRFEMAAAEPFAVGSDFVFPSVSEYSDGTLMAGYVNSATDYNVFVSKSRFGNATSSNVLNGKTYTSAAGLDIAGTMPDNGAAAIQLSDLTAKPVTAGYYSGGTAKVADAEAAKIIPENIKKGVTILGVEGTMEASAGGDYNIAATTNADGTQNLAITDAAGGGGQPVAETWVLNDSNLTFPESDIGIDVPFSVCGARFGFIGFVTEEDHVVLNIESNFFDADYNLIFLYASTIFEGYKSANVFNFCYYGEEGRTLRFYEAVPDGDFKTWLQANATKR